ncbi:hypothetical protein ACFE04_001504 [Oxalis oulophora]
MRRQEKRRKLHEAIVNTLYPPPLSPPSQEDEFNVPRVDFDVESINPDDKSSSSSSSHEEESESKPSLTRAQRKKLRKKIIKEDNARRRNVIGPLLPEAEGKDCSLDVRQNACERVADDNEPGEPSPCVNRSKVKQRRKIKKLAKDQKANVSVTDGKNACQEKANFSGTNESLKSSEST